MYRQLSPRINRNAFDLVTLAIVNGVVLTPMTIHFTMIMMFRSTLFFDICDDIFNILDFTFIYN
ncbi:hypothetical protein [Bacterioplanoides sp.]|uniref:hypothetical protein n=1 Tax=Bacterioplanoides sp. TaxID=2066072 RepID=UPI003B5AB2AE